MNPQQPNSDDEDLLNVSTGSNPPSGKPDELLGTSDFIELLGTKEESYYIDKTKLVDVFLKCRRKRVLVTAPRRFGKTINLLMMKTFFELQVPTEEYKTVSEDDFQIKVKETANYKLFQEHQLEITKNLDLMKKHFGKYPVLYISFKCEAIENLYDIKDFVKNIISCTFQDHSYLLDSKALNSWEKTVVSKWCGNEWDVEKNRYEILLGLKTLAQCLYKHFNKKIVLLIDDYDSAIIQAILNLKTKEELKHAIQFCTGVIQAAVKNDIHQHIEYAFITGISHICGMGLSGSNIKPFIFLENHSFVPYYGLTTMEVRLLLKKTYEFDDQRIAEVENKFNGYSTVRGVKMCNMWCVLEYASKAKKDDFTCEWQDTRYIVGLKEAFRFPKIMKIIQTQLLSDNPIRIKQVKCFRIEDVLALVNIIGNVDPQDVEYSDTDIFFSFILEQGYLSFVAKEPGLFVIPNEQIKEEIMKDISVFNIKIFGSDDTLIENCREFFLKICMMNCDYDDFKKFNVNLEAILQNYAAIWIKNSVENIRCTIKILINNLGFKDGDELSFKLRENGVEYRRQFDCFFSTEDFLMLIETKYKESNKQAMHYTKDIKYLKVIEYRKRYVVMVINMDENGQVSIGCLQNDKNFDAMTLVP